MRHPLGDLPLPPIVGRLVEHVRATSNPRRSPRARVDRALRPLPDADPLLASLAFGAPLGPPEALRTRGHPFEVVALFWSGGGGLRFGLAWLDAAVAPVGVSYAPGEDGAVWLGDTPTAAVAHLLGWAATAVADEPWADAELAAEDRSQGESLARALGLPWIEPTPLGPGGRSDRPPTLTLPAGWRHEPAGDGIGTAAPAAAFRPGEPAHPPQGPQAWVAAAHRALADGFPGTALSCARHGYRASGGGVAAAAAMAAAYRALGRAPLAHRAEAYVALHGDAAPLGGRSTEG